MKALEEMNETTTYTMDLEIDEDGYLDKECPNPECLSKFKVYAEDWKEKFSDEEVYCPFCGNAAPADSWWTTEQIEQAKEQAIDSVKAKINQAIKKDTEDFNRHSNKKGFITMGMKVSGSTYAVDLPAAVLEVMQQKLFVKNVEQGMKLLVQLFTVRAVDIILLNKHLQTLSRK